MGSDTDLVGVCRRRCSSLAGSRARGGSRERRSLVISQDHRSCIARKPEGFAHSRKAPPFERLRRSRRGSHSRASPAHDDIDVKEARLAHPSGWLKLTRHDGVPIVVDALLDLPPGRECHKTELAEFAGVTRQTVGKYVGLLVELDVIAAVPETSPQRYRLADGEVVDAIFELNAALNAAREV